eukprot:TRINITY_DN809_c1_g2_i1.p1 TRINITY_DN809_c1_g2~~TRINITY_DN809_c1_g2_i1.p1  ORF type:complete len:198 (-),score=39.01 TRINITY_DN809_c1_g2_i1:222-761(-)
MAMYGWALRHAVGIGRDRRRGEQLQRESKHAVARAMCLMYGFGVPGDVNESHRLLTTECDSTDPHVQYLMGVCSWYGWGCIANEPEAVQRFTRAGNHVFAVYRLALASSLGQGVPQDYVRAEQLYRHAAEQGYDLAQFRLGWMFERGIAVPKDLEQAKHWMQMAAGQGNEQAKLWCTQH